jgi:hypothetical protein
MTEATTVERDRNGRWVAGSKTEHCGNPHGRPLGARTKLSDAFLKDMLAAWEQCGTKAIETFVEERPHEFVKLVASILPRHFNVKVNEFDELTDEQLLRQVAIVREELARAGIDPISGGAAPEAPESTLFLSALPEAM